MKRQVLAAVAAVFVTATAANAERHIVIDVSTTNLVDEWIPATYYLGIQSLGAPLSSIETLLVGSVFAGDIDGHRVIAQRMVPAEGIEGVTKRFGSISGISGFRVTHPDDVQFWISTDEVDWTLLPPYVHINVRVDGPDGTFQTLTFVDEGSNGFASSLPSGVPAVGSFGFGIMVLLALSAGTVLFRRKRQVFQEA